MGINDSEVAREDAGVGSGGEDRWRNGPAGRPLPGDATRTGHTGRAPNISPQLSSASRRSFRQRHLRFSRNGRDVPAEWRKHAQPAIDCLPHGGAEEVCGHDDGEDDVDEPGESAKGGV